MKSSLVFFFISIMLIILFFADISFGSLSIPLLEIIKTFIEIENTENPIYQIIINGRVPQALTALFAGSGLAIGGLLMQTLFRNPLAGPSVLGISSGASLGVALSLLLLTQNEIDYLNENYLILLSAIIGSSAILVLILLASRFISSSTTLLIIGLMMGYVTSALVSILEFYASKESLQTFIFWGLGTFSNVTWAQLQLFLPVILFGIFLSIILIKPLDVLLLGDNYTKSLGVNIQRIKLVIILCVGIITGIITAFCGPIAFVGIAVPHIARLIFKTSIHRVLLPGVVILGGAISLMCDLISKLPGYEGTLPINAITCLFGAPVIIWLLIKQHN